MKYTQAITAFFAANNHDGMVFEEKRGVRRIERARHEFGFMGL